MDYDANNSTNVITHDGELVKATKYGYGQETAYIGENGKHYLQNPVTLEVKEADLDKDFVNEPVTPEGPGVIMANPKSAQAPKKAAKASSKAADK